VAESESGPNRLNPNPRGPQILFSVTGWSVDQTVYMGLDSARVGWGPSTARCCARARVPSFKQCRPVLPRVTLPMAPVHPFDTYSNNFISIQTRAGNADASSVMTERMKETVSLCASAFLLTVTAVSVAADAVNERAVVQLQESGDILMEASNAARTNETMVSNVSIATSRWYGQNPFMMASAAAARSQLASAPAVASETTRISSSVLVGQASGGSAKASVAATQASVAATQASVAATQASVAAFPTGKNTESLVGRIQWLNQVTLRVTDELELIHPPPIKKLFAQVTNSGMAGELEGAGKVLGTVASDLKEGFVGLVGTIESISRGEDSGIHLPERVSEDKGGSADVKSAAAVVDGTPETGDR
jgi:hypothetical protein